LTVPTVTVSTKPTIETVRWVSTYPVGTNDTTTLPVPRQGDGSLPRLAVESGRLKGVTPLYAYAGK